MKILKVIEKVLFLVAITVGAAALSLSLLVDEGAKQPVVGLATTIVSFFIFGVGFVLLLIVTGGLLKFAKNDTASRVGEGFALAGILSVFAVSLYLIVKAAGEATNAKDVVISLSAIIGLVGGIFYALYAAVKGVIKIVEMVKPEINKNDPDCDPKIQAVLKWKDLLDKGIITKEEFEIKRVEILELKK